LRFWVFDMSWDIVDSLFDVSWDNVVGVVGRRGSRSRIEELLKFLERRVRDSKAVKVPRLVGTIGRKFSIVFNGAGESESRNLQWRIGTQ
jgi:hypothetical protein